MDEKERTEAYDSAARSLGLARDKVTEGADSVQKSASEEVGKLFVLEYKVIEYASTEPAESIEAALAALGAERWDCFHVEQRPDALRFYCKRTPKTFLRYIPRVF